MMFFKILKSTYNGIPISIRQHCKRWHSNLQIWSYYNRVFEKRVLNLSEKENIFFKSFYEPISQSVLSGKRHYLPGDMHFNDYGYNFLADLVTEWVVKNPQKSIGFAPQKEDFRD